MAFYDFLNLSPLEFELFTRDLLQKYLNRHIESFKSGRDGGIDLRCSINGETIIQCKRYNSSFNKLYTSLKKEVKKVIKLSPKRYIFVTSVGLSPKNKDDIKKLFSPYITTTEDIFGKDDLNNLLTQFPEVEKDHFKLWLSSINIIQNIVNQDIINQSLFLQEDIEEKIKFYVHNKSYYEAEKILKKERYVIISGNPGIGKTTLAQILAYSMLGQGIQEFINLSDNIKEGYKMLQEGKSQIFLYDDFLGSNFLDQRITKNEDRQILSFISKIQRSKDKYLIFTTREYILNQAKQHSESFNNKQFVKCTINPRKYTTRDRLKILHNHLFFNNTPIEYLQELGSQDYLSKIVTHSNYNPRIIESFTSTSPWENCLPINFPQKLIDLLDNPQKVWEHAFENTISPNAQSIMYNFLIMGDNTEYDLLYKACYKFAKSFNLKYSILINSLSFKQGIKELENSFLDILIGFRGERNIIYHNPSVQDFLVSYVNLNEDLKSDLITSSFYLDTILRITWILENSKNQYKINLSPKLESELEEKIISDFYTFECKSIQLKGDDMAIYKLKLLSTHFKNKKGSSINSFIPKEFEKIVNSNRITTSTFIEYTDLLLRYHNRIEYNLVGILTYLISLIYGHGDLFRFYDLREISPDIYDIIVEEEEDYFINKISDVITILCEDNDDSVMNTIDTLNDIENIFGVDVSDELEYLNELLETEDAAHGFYSESKDIFFRDDINVDMNKTDFNIDDIIGLFGK